MASFVFQTQDNMIRHDFVLSMLEAVKYQNWLIEGSHSISLAQRGADKTLTQRSDKDKLIMVGDVDFVGEYLSEVYPDISMFPLGIPKALRGYDFLKRGVWEYDKHNGNTEIPDVEGFYVKEYDRLNRKTWLVYRDKFKPPELGVALLTEPVEIQSEWRAFVYNNRLVGLKNYLGEFDLFPDVGFIRGCIEAYDDAPPAYTLDVGISEDRGTFVIELNYFFSCGLYGFFDARILPQMYIRGFTDFIKRMQTTDPSNILSK